MAFSFTASFCNTANLDWFASRTLAPEEFGVLDLREEAKKRVEGQKGQKKGYTLQNFDASEFLGLSLKISKSAAPL